MMRKRSIVALLLVVSMLLAYMPPMAVHAADTTVRASGACGDDLTWTLDSEGTLTISGTGAMYNFSYSAAPWFSSRTRIHQVILDEEVTSIGTHAFYGCSNLTNIGIPDNVTSIGHDAFYECSSLTGITIPDGVTSISYNTFYGCTNLASINIPNGVTSIGREAFYRCSSLNGITLPSSVTSIGEEAFLSCDSLTGIWVDNDNPNFSNDSYGVLFDKHKTVLVQVPGGISGNYRIPDSVTGIGKDAFFNCSSLTGITIPDGVTTIGEYAFYGCSGLTSIDIPDGVTDIGNDAFYGCSGLASIDIPDGVTVIGNGVFYGCSGLTGITIPNGVTSIGAQAFRACSNLSRITIPESVISIDEWAFLECSNLSDVYYGGTKTQWDAITIGTYNGSLLSATLHTTEVLYSGTCGENLTWTLDEEGILTISGTGAMTKYTSTSEVPWYDHRELINTIVLESNVTTVGDHAFYDCTNLKTVELPEGVTSIGSNAFRQCGSLSDITLPSNLTSIGSNAFCACYALNDITIPTGVTEIAYSVFYGCTGLTEITIPEGVTTIGDEAFNQCSSLTEITLPTSITTIGDFAFNKCSKLADVYYGGTQTQWEAISIGSSGNDPLLSATLHTTNQVLYSGTCGENLTWTLDDEGTLTISGTGAMTEFASSYDVPWYAYRDSILALDIQSGVTSIGEYAFYDCSSLTSVTIPDGVTSIGEYAFSSCRSLTSVTIPDSVTTIGQSAFKECTSLTSVTISDSVTTIGQSAFKECTSLTSVTIPDSVTTIGGNAFFGCTGLTGIWVSDGNPNYSSDQSGVLFDKNKSTLIQVPGGISGSYDIPDGVTAIGEYAFSYCRSLTSVTIPDSVTSIGDWAFSGCSSLTSVTIPDGVTSMDIGVFSGCSSLTSVTIGNSVTSIGGTAFAGCTSLTSVTIPDGVTSIGSLAFAGCTSLTSATIRNGVTSIGDSAFQSCTSLTSVDIPNSVTSIGYSVFYDCASLTSVTIGNGVTSIGDWAFNGCTGLKEVSFEGSAPTIDSNVFSNVIATAYYYPDETWTSVVMQNYGGTITWVALEGLKFTLSPDGTYYSVTGIGTCTETEIVIPDTHLGKPVKAIGNQAFSGFSSLTSVTIPDSVTSIEARAFQGCTGLTEVYYGGSKAVWNALENTPSARYIHYNTTNSVDHWTIDTQKANCTQDGYEQEICPCGYARNKVTTEEANGHSWTDATCTEPKTCSVCTATEGKANGHSWTDATCTAPKTCSVCSATEGVAAGHRMGSWNVVKIATPAGDGQEKRECEHCDYFETAQIPYIGHGVVLSGNLAKETTVYIDGLPYEVKRDGDARYVELPRAGQLTLVTYSYHEGDGKDVHTQYPTGMKVYQVVNGQVTHIPELDNLLQYSGSSIRIAGKKGIRMITSISKGNKAALTGKGLAGYTLEEYGTVLCFAKEIAPGDGLVLGRSYARSNYAYKKGVADPVFATSGNLVQYTNVLVGFSLDQCKEDIAMRPYIILKNAAGEKITLYGGTIYRSIGYIAYQNRNVFKPKTGSYNYVWELIHHVYGNKYDADYKG